ncbi:hypothetical protein [Nocardioides sp. Soil805]|uniref:hypothetical protein n=1 Tax=Nocardioides sp. Soil805 TaxID=1736416 RepID=UPI0007027AD7|nr:hypothetical protein [Nocardioides sp. Soil805]KRF34209.1 hypothetical protein ASG94_15925 [Nocardioides sp. Soil805]
MYTTYGIQSVARQQVAERVADAEQARRGRAFRRTWRDAGKEPVPARRAVGRVAAIRIVLPH